MKLDFIVSMIIVLVVLLLVIIFFQGQMEKLLSPMKDDVRKSTLCAQWVKNNCSILDPVYNRDLADMKLCDACSFWVETEGNPPAGMKLDDYEKRLMATCGGGDGVWDKCTKVCGCPGHTSSSTVADE